jgi:catechol 2,3-dioxygenase-like lactoylglutathione lyase family enzyme
MGSRGCESFPASIDGVEMSVQLNHTIVWSRDKQKSAAFLADVLGLAAPRSFGPFAVVDLDNDVSLDFGDDSGEISVQHYAFLIGEDDFDRVLRRIRELGLDHWADPYRRRPGEINHNDGGRGVYFPDPSGHLLEVITRPYGSGG